MGMNLEIVFESDNSLISINEINLCKNLIASKGFSINPTRRDIVFQVGEYVTHIKELNIDITTDIDVSTKEMILQILNRNYNTDEIVPNEEVPQSVVDESPNIETKYKYENVSDIQNKSNHAIFVYVNSEKLEKLIEFIEKIKSNYPAHPDILVFIDNDLYSTDLPNLKYEKVYLIKDKLSTDFIGENLEYKKVYAISHIFEDYENILYLDVDVMVLKPLDELLNKQEFFVVDDKSFWKDSGKIFKCDNQQELVSLNSLLEVDGIIHNHVDLANFEVFLVTKKVENCKTV